MSVLRIKDTHIIKKHKANELTQCEIIIATLSSLISRVLEGNNQSQIEQRSVHLVVPCFICSVGKQKASLNHFKYSYRHIQFQSVREQYHSDEADLV